MRYKFIELTSVWHKKHNMVKLCIYTKYDPNNFHSYIIYKYEARKLIKILYPHCIVAEGFYLEKNNHHSELLMEIK